MCIDKCTALMLWMTLKLKIRFNITWKMHRILCNNEQAAKCLSILCTLCFFFGVQINDLVLSLRFHTMGKSYGKNCIIVAICRKSKTENKIWLKCGENPSIDYMQCELVDTRKPCATTKFNSFLYFALGVSKNARACVCVCMSDAFVHFNVFCGMHFSF